MGFGLKSVTKSVKKGVGKVVKEARAPEKAIRQVPTNANDITGNTRRLIRNAPRNLNSLTDSVRDAWKTRGASVITGYPEGSKAAHDRVVFEKQSKQQAEAAAEQQRVAEAAAAKKAEFDARMSRERGINNAYVDSLSGMRRMAMPNGVQGQRYGDINRGMSTRAPTQNVGMVGQGLYNNPRTGVAMGQQMQPYRGPVMGPGQPPPGGVMMDPIRGGQMNGQMPRFEGRPMRTGITGQAPVQQQPMQQPAPVQGRPIVRNTGIMPSRYLGPR